MTRQRILFVLHLPPPVHGAAVVGEMIRSSKTILEGIDGRFINLSASRTGDEIGRGGFRKLLRILALRREVRRTVRTFRPTKLYCTPSAGFPGILKDWFVLQPARRQGIPVIAHFHNRGVPAAACGWKERLYRSFFKDIRVILLSERLVPEFAPYARDVRICPNGIDPLVISREEHAVLHGPTLLFLSNLIRSKGVYTLLEACGILQREGKDFRCVFAGAACYDVSPEAFEQKVDQLGIRNVISYSGPCYGEEKAALFAAADVFVLPTRYPNESFPLVILEAMSASLPVVSTDTGAIEDMVVDGETGFICKDDSPVTLACCLSELIDNPSLGKRMGEAAHERFLSRYTRACFEDRMRAILSE